MSNKCHEREASCLCDLEEGHGGAHVCKCGGKWEYNEDGFNVVELPGVAPGYPFAELAGRWNPS